MSSDQLEPADLLDLKLLPSWLKESDRPVSYEHYQGGEGEEKFQRSRERNRTGRPPGRSRDDSSRPREKRSGKGRPGDRQSRDPRAGARTRTGPERPRPREAAAVPEDLSGRLAVRFVPYGPALENVVSQIKSYPISYSVFALARLFLEKPERYEVSLTARDGAAPFYQLGEHGSVSLSRDLLESNAFRLARNDFYRVDVTQGEPIKGNFPTVARCRLSGTILGPTSHHAYQSKLRALYDQRFSRRMGFPEFLRQIEIVRDPAVVEQWKEEARNLTTFTTLKEEPALTFPSAAEAERHFRLQYVPDLVRPVTEPMIGGVQSRQLLDRPLGRFIEMSWSKEIRSPSQMMQELSARLRDSGLQIFRHRRGMLFVSSVRPRPFAHQSGQAISAQVQRILEILEANRGLKKKELAEKILADVAPEEGEPRKLALASDLRWLISEGHVIEFNDGSLDLPRVKPPPPSEAGKDANEDGPKEQPQPSEGIAPAAEASEGLLAPPPVEIPGDTDLNKPGEQP